MFRALFDSQRTNVVRYQATTYQVDELAQLVTVGRLEQHAFAVSRVPLKEELVALGRLGIHRRQAVLMVGEAVDAVTGELEAHLAKVVRSFLERIYDSTFLDLG